MTGRLTLISRHAGPVVSITVIDGNTTDTFYVHKNLLLRASPFFAALSNFKEGDENHIVLNDVDLLAFHHIQNWFYEGRLDPKLKQSRHTLIKVWVAADRLLMTTCKNKVMDTLRALHGTNTPAMREYSAFMTDLNLACSYGHGPDRALVRYIMEQMLWDQLHDGVQHKDDFKKSQYEKLSLEVIVAMFKKKDDLTRSIRWQLENGFQILVGDPTKANPCIYHEHGEDERCHLRLKRSFSEIN